MTEAEFKAKARCEVHPKGNTHGYVYSWAGVVAKPQLRSFAAATAWFSKQIGSLEAEQEQGPPQEPMQPPLPMQQEEPPLPMQQEEQEELGMQQDEEDEELGMQLYYVDDLEELEDWKLNILVMKEDDGGGWHGRWFKVGLDQTVARMVKHLAKHDGVAPDRVQLRIEPKPVRPGASVALRTQDTFLDVMHTFHTLM